MEARKCQHFQSEDLIKKVNTKQNRSIREGFIHRSCSWYWSAGVKDSLSRKLLIWVCYFIWTDTANQISTESIFIKFFFFFFTSIHCSNPVSSLFDMRDLMQSCCWLIQLCLIPTIRCELPKKWMTFLTMNSELCNTYTQITW